MSDPVLIVGAGPTGLMAALELSRLGIPVRLVDKRAGPATTSRAIGIQARTLELMEQRGLADEMVRLGHKGHYGSVYGGGKRVFRLDFSKVDSRYDFLLFLSQAETERILRDALEKHGVRPEWGVTLVAFAQQPQGPAASPVSAMLKHDGGRGEPVKAPWLISAEGAHSVVRNTLDLRFEGKTLDVDYALGDVQIEGDVPDTDFHIFSSEHGFMALFPLGGSHFRLIASHPHGDPSRGSPPTEAELQAVYDERSSLPARFHDTSWTSWFRINSRMVSRLRAGRLLLGGDSAHIHSPAGAQGMNTGIQDMVNLCWKLALVIKGRAPDSLLDTYEQDRLPVMRDVLFKTENLTEVIASENPVARTLFNHLGPWIGGAAVIQDSSTNRMAQVSLGYHDSELSPKQPHPGSVGAGDRAPEVLVAQRTASGWEEARLLTVLDPSTFTLLVVHPSRDALPDSALRDAIAPAGDLVKLVELAPPEDSVSYRRLFGASPGVFLVRPDGYVAVAAGAHGGRRALETFIARWLTPPG